MEEAKIAFISTMKEFKSSLRSFMSEEYQPKSTKAPSSSKAPLALPHAPSMARSKGPG